MRTDRVVLLTCEGEPGRIAARYLAARFPAVTVIVEDPVPRALLLRRRIKRLGFVHVARPAGLHGISADPAEGLEIARRGDYPRSRPRPALAR